MKEEKRPIKNFAESFCFGCKKDQQFQLNSDENSYTAEFECQICGHKTDYIVR